MRPLQLLGILLVAFCAKVHAGIKTSEAGNYVGETGVVSGTVVQVSRVGDLTFVDSSRPNPDSEFTAVIKGHPSAYGDLAFLEGKEEDVEGTITLHKGRPKIELSSPLNLRPAGTASRPTRSR